MSAWKNASEFPPFLTIKEGETTTFTLRSTKMQQSTEAGFSPYILVLHDGVEKNLSLSTVLRSKLQKLIDEQSVAVGTEFQVKQLGKKQSEKGGKKYNDFKVEYRQPQ